MIMKYIIIILQILSTFENMSEIKYFNDECIKKTNPKGTYLDDSNTFLLEILRGKIPILNYKDVPLNDYDINIIKRINKNIPCPYYLNNTGIKSEKTNGIFLGAGINLKNFNKEEANNILINSGINISFQTKYLSLFEYIYNDKQDYLKVSNNPLGEIDKFNKAFIDYSVKRFLNRYNKYLNNKKPYINSILSVYIQLQNSYDFLYNLLGGSLLQASYTIEHLFEIFPNTRLIQSKLINMIDGNIKFNNNHLFFVVPTFLFGNKAISEIKGIINYFYEHSNKYAILNANRISILAINNNNNFSKYIIDYNSKNNNLDELLKNENKNKNGTELIDLEKIYDNLNEQFNNNIKKNLFENQIAILFSKYDSIKNSNPDDLIENYRKKYNIQSIPIIDIDNVGKKKYNNIFKYNLFYNFSDYISEGPLKMAISNMHIYVDLTNKDQITLNKLSNNDIDIQIYIEVDINKGSEDNEYYEISLEISKTSGYNIFISDTHPYPNIRNYKSKFLKYENNNNPKMRIKSKGIDKFYIGIEGILKFDINIKKDNDLINSLIDGDYDYVVFNTSIKFKDNRLSCFTFGSDYRINSSFFKGEANENLMQYFARGIDLDNTIDHSFFNYELFLYLFGNTELINRVYRDKNNNYYFGRYYNTTIIAPIDLKNDGFNRLTINKLYPFLGINNILNKSAPSISFTEEEIKIIYNITYITYVSELSNKLKRYPQCTPFNEQNPTKKFILFCLYFYYYYDNYIMRNIVQLSSKEPNYTEVLEYLKKKQDDNSFLINYVKQMEQEDKLEKMMISIIIGQSLLLSDIGINFINEFYNTMSKSKTKISVSSYDTLKSEDNIEIIIPFSSISNTKPDELSSYNETELEERIKYSNSEQKMDFDKILNFGLSQFSKYDDGIKKKIIIVCDERIKTRRNKININNVLYNINSSNETNMNLIDKQIDLLIITSKNYEKGEKHDLFKKENRTASSDILYYSLYENYFHVNNLRNTLEFMNDLERVLQYSPIKIKPGKRFINDFYQGKMSYLKIYTQDNPSHVIVIRTNLSNFNFYYSFTHPFPNSYTSELLKPISDNAIIISDIENGVYLGIESINSIDKQIFEIFTCENYNPNKNCQLIGSYTNTWYIFFASLFVWCLFILIYRCKKKINPDLVTKETKRLNVFDNVK